MSAADEVLKLREDLRAAKSNGYRLELEKAQIEGSALKLVETAERATAFIRELKQKLTFWRVMAFAEAGMLAAIWANTYIFGGGA